MELGRSENYSSLFILLEESIPLEESDVRAFLVCYSKVIYMLKPPRFFLPSWCLAAMGMWLVLSASERLRGEEPSPKVDFREVIRPILAAKCYRCHDEKKQEGKLDMSRRKKLLQGGNSGPALVPGNVEKSLMMELIEFGEMPPSKEKQPVTKEEFEKLSAWINAGAPMPDPDPDPNP
jgi:hypothetical protein